MKAVLDDDTLSKVLDVAIIVTHNFQRDGNLPPDITMPATMGVLMLVGALAGPPDEVTNSGVYEIGRALVKARLEMQGGTVSDGTD